MPEQTLKRIDLGQSGIAYLAKCLRGERELSGKLSRIVGQGGVSIAFVPDDTPLPRVMDFESGGLIARSASIAALADHIQSSPILRNDDLLIVHDVWSKPDDHDFLPPLPLRLFRSASGAYSYARRSELNRDTLKDAANWPTSFSFVGAVTRCPAFDLQAHAVVPESLIDALADGAREVYVSAYDQEGFVIWQRLNR